MSEWNWQPYLVGGGTRPDAVSGLSPQFTGALSGLFQNAPEDIRANLRVTSAYRSPEVQKTLWDAALKKYGSPEAARKWVAPPGNSKHNHGMAADLKYLSPAAQQWAHENAAKFGLHFPMKHEPWHVEPLGSRGGAAAPVAAVSTAAGQPVATAQGGDQRGILAAMMAGDMTDDEKGGLNRVAGLLGSAQGVRPPEIQQRQVQPYQAPQRDVIAPYLQLFQALG